MAPRPGYSAPQIALHWIAALLIVAAYVTGDGMGRVLDRRIAEGWSGIEGNTVHVWLGGTVFAVVLVRLLVRILHRAPPHLPGTPPRLALAATWGHRALYALMIAVPALGATAWYGQVEAAGEAHEIAVNLLLLTFVGHVAAAFWHAIALGDETLNRIVVPGSRVGR